MSIDALFVLSAGMGTRMGKIGEVLPKPLWPVFEKTLVELQFDFFQWLPANKKFINAHHQSQLVQRTLRQKIPGLQILHEPELLGIGGGLVNLKRYAPEVESIVISNVDQFFFVDRDIVLRQLDNLSHYDVILFAMPVTKSQGYRKLEVSREGVLLGINLQPQEESFLTYSGVALVRGSAITLSMGKGEFFQSIAHPEKRRVKVVNGGEGRYYDFGTLTLYLQRITELSRQLKSVEKGGLLDFLRQSKAIYQERFHPKLNSYNSGKACEYRFGPLAISLEGEGRISLAE